jgi:hypothetical protein
MSFVFQRRYDVFEPFNVGGCHAPRDAPFQIGQVTTDPAGQLSTLRCQPDQESPAIGFPDLPSNQAAVRKTIENTGQCRSFVGKAAMQISHVRGSGMRE